MIKKKKENLSCDEIKIIKLRLQIIMFFLITFFSFFLLFHLHSFLYKYTNQKNKIIYFIEKNNRDVQAIIIIFVNL